MKIYVISVYDLDSYKVELVTTDEYRANMLLKHLSDNCENVSIEVWEDEVKIDSYLR